VRRSAACAWLLAGCATIPPAGAPMDVLATTGAPDLEDRLEATGRPSERGCLFVMLPGIGDRARSFEENGFVSEALSHAPECDVVLADAHFTYYVDQSVHARLATDVLADAHRLGYRRVWLVGVSLGGYGAVLTARRHPELVDGVVLIAPMQGVPPREQGVAEEIASAGGLHEWPGLEGFEPRPRHHFREPRLIWDWLRTASLETPDRIVLAYGRGDRLRPRHRLLAEALAEERVFETEGAHDWSTWRVLWRDVLRARTSWGT